MCIFSICISSIFIFIALFVVYQKSKTYYVNSFKKYGKIKKQILTLFFFCSSSNSLNEHLNKGIKAFRPNMSTVCERMECLFSLHLHFTVILPKISRLLKSSTEKYKQSLGDSVL